MALVLAAASCGSGGASAPASKAGLPSSGVAASSGAAYAPSSPIDQARHLLDEAAGQSEPAERCRELRDALSLDASSREAHLAYAQSRCEPARSLLAHARFVFDAAPSPESATLLATVATRASSPDDARAAVKVLEGAPDVEAHRLAARTAARFGDHERAARILEAIAADRASKGGAVDALDARLDAAMESARALGKGAASTPRAEVLRAIKDASSLEAGYGGAWIGPKLVEAIGALRAAGDAAAANDAEKAALQSGAIAAADARHALELERAIGEARAGNTKGALSLAAAERKAGRVRIPASRALLAVIAKATGKCGAARAYARAHDAIEPGPIPRFDDDVAWARDCSGGEFVSTAAYPRPSDAVEDASAVADVDLLRGRAALQAITDADGNDVAAALALVAHAPIAERLDVVDRALKRSRWELALHLARLELLTGSARSSEAAEIARAVLPATIEVYDDPRAAAPTLATLMMRASDGAVASAAKPPKETIDAAIEVATALLQTCGGAPAALPCVTDKGEAVGRAAELLADEAPDRLAKYGPALCDADLSSAPVRLAVVIALVEAAQLGKAEALASASRGKWETPEAGLALAFIAAEKKDCEGARMRLAQWPTLASMKEYAPEVAAVKTKCKL